MSMTTQQKLNTLQESAHMIYEWGQEYPITVRKAAGKLAEACNEALNAQQTTVIEEIQKLLMPVFDFDCE